VAGPRVPRAPYHRLVLAEPRISNLVLILLFMVLNVVIIAAVLIFKDSDSDDSKESVRIPRAGSVVVNRAIGARIRMPRGWLRERHRRAIVLRSPDSTTIMSISEPPGADSSRAVLGAAVDAIRRGYRRVRVRRIGGKVAGLPAVNRVVSATNKRGIRLNILVSAAQGRRRAWLIEVFSGPGARGERLPEAQVSLGTLRLRG
jgi:hypothetical protein